MAKSNKLAIKSRGKILPSIPSDVQVIEHGRDIHMYRLTDEELDTLAMSYHSLNLFFFSLCIGALFVLVVTLVTINLPDRTFAVFIALACVAFLLGIYFGAKVCMEKIGIKRNITKIRESRKVPD